LLASLLCIRLDAGYEQEKESPPSLIQMLYNS
jgi:hypothetical protein